MNLFNKLETSSRTCQKIHQIANLLILLSIVNFPNWISDTFCVNPWRKLLPSPAGMPDCRPDLPETERLKAEPGLMISLFDPPDRTQIRDISSPGPPPMESTPISVCSQAVIHKVGGLHGAKTPVGSQTRPRFGHQNFQHFSSTFKIGCAGYGFSTSAVVCLKTPTCTQEAVR